MSSYIQHTHTPSSVAGLTEPENRKDLGDTGRIEIVHAATSGESLHTGDHVLEDWLDAQEPTSLDIDPVLIEFDFSSFGESINGDQYALDESAGEDDGEGEDEKGEKLQFLF